MIIKARSVRTRAESVMASILDSAKIHYRQQKGFIRGTREFIIADFYLTRRKAVIEVDGGYHKTPEQKRRDRRKDALYKDMGLRVIRYTNEKILTHPEIVLAEVQQMSEGGVIYSAQGR